MIGSLFEQLGQAKIGERGYMVVCDSDGSLVYHPDAEQIMTGVDSMECSGNVKNALDTGSHMAVAECTVGTDTLCDGVKHIDKLNWSVFGCMPQAEYTQKSKTMMRKTHAVCVVCEIILTVICVIMANAIVHPIKKLSAAADEVRNLAGKSNDAAKNTTQLIQCAIDAIGEGAKIADDTASSISAVAEKTRGVMENIDDIATDCRKQTRSLGEAAEGIDQISGVVQMNSATTEEMRHPVRNFLFRRVCCSG